MKILNYGSMNIDHVYNVDHMVAPGETILAHEMNNFCGGKGLNQSIAIAKAGGEIYHAGILGEDGGDMLSTLKRHHVNTDYIEQASGLSSHTVIQVDRQGQNCIIVFAGDHMRISEARIDQILEGFSSGDALVMQNELHNSPLMMRKAKQKGLLIIFNPSPINDQIQTYPLESVDWFLLNEVEGAALTGETEPNRILAQLHCQYPAASVVLTLGKEGAYCMHNGETLFQPAFAVKAVDTTAAGDTFTGYFVTGFAQGKPLAAVLERAARASSITVGRMGAAGSIPYASELE
ncbi:MAG: ribokinase [Clostridia bacterium]